MKRIALGVSLLCTQFAIVAVSARAALADGSLWNALRNALRESLRGGLRRRLVGSAAIRGPNLGGCPGKCQSPPL